MHCPHDGAFLIEPDELDRAPRDPRLGTVVDGRYPLLALLGRGGMGAVYRSLQKVIDRPVAVKLIQVKDVDTSPTDAEAARLRFLQEARTIAAIDHPNVVRLHDFGFEEDGTLYMVQELVEGKSLRARIAAVAPHELTSRDAVRLAGEVLDGLHAAHEHGVVHRDVKPENVMLAGDRVKVLDFGIAKRLPSEATMGLTTEGAVFGTPAYMSPEQALGAANIDARSDVHAVGVLLYEMLCGETPYAAPTMMATLLRVVNQPAPPLRPRGRVPPELDDIIGRALEKKAMDRYRSAAEMATALRGLDWSGATGRPRPAAPPVNIASAETVELDDEPPARVAPPQIPWAPLVGVVAALALAGWLLHGREAAPTAAGAASTGADAAPTRAPARVDSIADAARPAPVAQSPDAAAGVRPPDAAPAAERPSAMRRSKRRSRPAERRDFERERLPPPPGSGVRQP